MRCRRQLHMLAAVIGSNQPHAKPLRGLAFDAQDRARVKMLRDGAPPSVAVESALKAPHPHCLPHIIFAATGMNTPSVCRVKSDLCFEVIHRVILYDWNADFQGEADMVGHVTPHPRIERKK